MSGRLQLRRYEINSLVWDEIQKTYESELEYTDNIYSKVYGYSDKHKIFFNEEFMVLQEYRFNYICKNIYNKDIIDKPSIWKQIVVRLNEEVDRPMKQITGTKAYEYINSLLLNDYTEQEIEDVLNAHTAEYSDDLKQYHTGYNTPLVNTIFKWNEIYKYDIHKAHASVLMQLFPKSKNRILELLNKAKKAKKAGKLELAKEYKDYPNLYVGALCINNHRPTYNYIVQTITRKLLRTIEKVNGQIIYANTDSFAVIYPEKILPDSEEFGEFGLEYHGPAYVCRGDNYTIYKFGDDIKGSCRKKVRNLFDFENGIIAHYKQNRYQIGITKNNRKLFRTELTNICTEKVNVVEL